MNNIYRKVYLNFNQLVLTETWDSYKSKKNYIIFLKPYDI